MSLFFSIVLQAWLGASQQGIPVLEETKHLMEASTPLTLSHALIRAETELKVVPESLVNPFYLTFPSEVRGTGEEYVVALSSLEDKSLKLGYLSAVSIKLELLVWPRETAGSFSGWRLCTGDGCIEGRKLLRKKHKALASLRVFQIVEVYLGSTYVYFGFRAGKAYVAGPIGD